MTKDEIDRRIDELSDGNRDVLVVFTGGEPTMQLAEDEIIGGERPKAIETNGIL